MTTKWVAPEQLLETIQQAQDPQWRAQGASILQAVVEAWQRQQEKPRAEVKPSRFGKRLFFKATRTGPKYAGSMQDASGRHMCFQSGKRVPCQQYGGAGEGWSQLRSQEDLYDALRRLVDEIKAGKHEGWHELLGVLVHAPVEDLLKLKQEHGLSAPGPVKDQLAQRLQEELQHVGHTVDEAQPGAQQNA